MEEVGESSKEPVDVSAIDDGIGEQARRERALIARAEAEFASGDYLDEDQVDEWLDRLDIDPDAAVPTPRRHTPASE